MMHQNIPGHPYPSAQYPPNQYGQHYQMSHNNTGYMMQPNQTNAYPPHPGQPNTVGPQRGAPPPLNYPTVRSWQQPGPGPASGPVVPAPTLIPGKGEIVAPKPLTQSQPDSNVPPSITDPNQSIRPPMPSNGTVAAANPFNDISAPRPPTSLPHASNQFPAPPETAKQAHSQRIPQEVQRPTPPPRPGMMPNQYPYSNR